jgi:hypothetical protein
MEPVGVGRRFPGIRYRNPGTFVFIASALKMNGGPFIRLVAKRAKSRFGNFACRVEEQKPNFTFWTLIFINRHL